MSTAPRDPVLCVDVGSTFTKAVLVDAAAGTLLATGSAATHLPPAGDALASVAELRRQLAQQAGVPERSLRGESLLVCSSAGGGLRIAVVGQEQLVSAQAGHRVALTAGGAVVHVHAGPLDATGLQQLRLSRPDVVLLVGGTDGGNEEVLRHNALRLGIDRIPVPIVVAGNAAAAPAAVADLERRGRQVVLADNVLPQIGHIEPGPARAAIREMFLRHVIGGKQLSQRRIAGARFGALVRMPTPEAMLTGVTVLGSVGNDVLVLDIGGATTDVYSAITPHGEDATLRKDVVAPLWSARTVEADLGMRWSAAGVLAAAESERLLEDWPAARIEQLRAHVRTMTADPSLVPHDAAQASLDHELATLAALVAVRRHGRPGVPGGAPRPLADVAVLLGSGGVLRHADAQAQNAVLGPVLRDHAGGWRVPQRATTVVDRDYVLFAVGLLAHVGRHGQAPGTLASTLLG